MDNSALQDSKGSYKIDKKIYIVFIALVLITIVNAVVSTYVINKSKDITIEIAEVTHPSQAELFELTQLATKSWMYITNWVYLPNHKSDKEHLIRINQQDYPSVKAQLLSLSKSWKDNATIDSLKYVFEEYDKLVYYENQVMNKLVDFDDYQDPIKKFATEELVDTEIIPRAKRISASLAKITEIKKKEATLKQGEMIQSFIMLTAVVLGLGLLIVNLVIVITFFISKNIIGPVMKIKYFIVQLSKGELPELNIKIPSNAVGEMINALKSHVEGLKRTSLFANEIGKGNFNSQFDPLSENDVQGKALMEMRDKLKYVAESEATSKWMSEGIERISIIMRDFTSDIDSLCDSLAKEIVTFVGAQQGAIFLVSKEDKDDHNITINGGFGINKELLLASQLNVKESLVGQCIHSNQNIFITNHNSPLFAIDTGLYKTEVSNIYILPLFAGGEVIGSIQVASVHVLTNSQLVYLNRILEPLSAGMHGVMSNSFTRRLLEESIKQADELSAQKQELRWANDELVNKSKELGISQIELQVQQEELKKVNGQLEIKAHLLEERNLAIEEARQSLAFKAEQLEQSSKYKSAFLANMSHELRTPLNSILILAKLLSDNKTANLTPKQVEHSRVIHKSGGDLLMLINDILDLSKIESGKLEFIFEKIKIRSIGEDMKLLFNEFANEKQIEFKVDKEEDAFDDVTTDKMRLEQVVKNLLSNAFKFTEKSGNVTLRFAKAIPSTEFRNENLHDCENILAISVTDTGIGIPAEKQKIIFEAFQQADNSTSRKYGGTGLGLTISREIVHILGGEITLTSTHGEGSTFTIYIPQHSNAANTKREEDHEAIKEVIQEKQPSILAKNTEVKTFEDNDFADDRDFITEHDKTVLIIEDDVEFLKVLIDYCHIYGYKALATKQGETGLAFSKKHKPYAIILDLMLPDTDGWIVLSKFKEDEQLQNVPVHIVTALDKKPIGIKHGAASYIKKPIDKPQLEKLFMNLESYSNEQEETANDPMEFDQYTLKGKTILMADDDMRNIYALTTLIESAGANLICAYDGKEAIDKLENNPHIDIVLMDVMMPVMNGYEAITEIRKQDKYKNLPVLAVTAKALEGERERCREAGASDYISKPVNNDLLITKIKFWLYQ